MSTAVTDIDLERLRVKRALKAEKTDEPKDNILTDDGLRYRAKKAGSPFGPSQMMNGAATMSCFKCGIHRPNSELESKRYFGKMQRVCAGGCKR